MIIFIFKPSNDFAGKVEVERKSGVHSAVAAFVAAHPSLPELSYAEGFGTVWTITGCSPFQLEEGRVSRKPSAAGAGLVKSSSAPAVSSSAPAVQIETPSRPLLTSLYYVCGVIFLFGAAGALVIGNLLWAISSMVAGVVSFGLGQVIMLFAKIEVNTRATAVAAQQSANSLATIAGSSSKLSGA